MAVRSTVLAQWHSVANSTVTLRTLGAGQTGIIKSVVVNNRSGVAARCVVQWVTPSPALTTDVFNASVAAAFDPVILSCWVVGLPADSVVIFCDQAAVDFRVSGALLSG